MYSYLLHHLLTNTARQNPDKKAVIFKDKSLTYSELDAQSDQFAATLSGLGIRMGDRVGIILGKSIEAIISIFGILKAGAAYVPVDYQSPMSRTQHILKNCGISAVISSHTMAEKIIKDPDPELSLRTIIVTGTDSRILGHGVGIKSISFETILNEGKKDDPQVEMADVSPAYILHTSGSTGLPKGVVISHLNALSFVNMAAEFFHIGIDDRFGNVAPLHFDLSVFDIFVAVKAGAAIILVPEYLTAFPIRLAEYIENQRITVWNSVSSLLSMLAEKGGLERVSLESLRILHFSGEILPIKYLRILKNCMQNAKFYNIYGQTEANSSVYYQVRELQENDHWKIPIGRPFPNFEVFIMGEDGSEKTAPGDEGELYVKSSTVAIGYWGREEETREKFVSDPRDLFGRQRCYKTGDLVRIDDDGNYVFVGRKDHMIKSRGYRIELAEIEAVLNSHPLIRQAVVTAIPDELIGNRLIGHVSLVERGVLSKNDLYRFCSSPLPKYMIPGVFKFHDGLPLSSTGKVNRKALEGQDLNDSKVEVG